MRIQIVNDDGEVIHIPSHNQHLERDLRALLSEEHRWRPWRRRAQERLHRKMDAVIDEMRQLTIHAAGEPPRGE